MTTDRTKAQSDFADLTDFQRDILVVLAGLAGENGSSIKEELESYYGESVNHGRLYPNLDTLADEGLVDKFSLDNRSNGYKLTEEGSSLIRVRIRWEREKLANTEGGEQSTGENDTSPSEKNSDAEDSSAHADPIDPPVEDQEEFTCISDLPIDEPSHQPIPLKVVQRHETGELKEEELTVVDTAGESAKLVIWAKHVTQSALETGDWFMMSGTQLSQWERNDRLARSLSSIDDTTIQKMNRRGSDNTTSPDTDLVTGQEPKSSSNTDETGILSDIRDEFDLDP